MLQGPKEFTWMNHQNITMSTGPHFLAFDNNYIVNLDKIQWIKQNPEKEEYSVCTKPSGCSRFDAFTVSKVKSPDSYAYMTTLLYVKNDSQEPKKLT